jgi:hypothetical protein
MNFYLDNDDLRFYLERGGADWAGLVGVSEHQFKARDGFKDVEEALGFYREVARTVGTYAAEEIAPHAAAIDREGVGFAGGEAVFSARLDKIFDGLRELELHGMCLPRELGGLNCPMLVYFLNSEMLARADVSVMSHHGFHGGMAMAMLFFSIHEGSTTFDAATQQITSTRFRAYIDEIARGAAWGCMDITEPDAGSDMARLRATAEQDESGQWRVSGQKIFITSGHGKYHFVIARTEQTSSPDDPFAGLGGLSMFLVPTYEDLPDGTRRRLVTLDRIEEKLGHHGSVTAALSFDRAPAELIGKRGEGFKYMLTLMNNARVGVGFESLGLMEAALRAATAYAADRGSMGKKIEKHELIADYLDEMRTDIQAIRALVVSAAYHEEMAQKLSLAARFGLDRDEASERRHRARSRRFTPLLKYLAAEKAVEHARRCIQIHGGNGYTQDYPGEKLLRDALVMPIYEGTSQIQSLMAMKDCLGRIMKNPQRFVRKMADAQWRSVSSRDPLDRRVARIQALSLAAQNHLVTRTAATKLRSLQHKPVSEWRAEVTQHWDPKRDFALAMLHAERLTRLLADEAICEILQEQAAAHPERRDLFERYLDRAEPRARFLHDEITTTGPRLLAQLEQQAEATREAAE